jgi:uncharacterized protein (UPF0332 family)
MDVEELFERRLLLKDRPDPEKAAKSLEMADHMNTLSLRAFSAGIYEDALINCYSCMFHAGRSLLYSDGIQEKSHYGLYQYLKIKYSGLLGQKYIGALNQLRNDRHTTLYGLEIQSPTEEDVKYYLRIAGEFRQKVRELLNP